MLSKLTRKLVGADEVDELFLHLCHDTGAAGSLQSCRGTMLYLCVLLASQLAMLQRRSMQYCGTKRR
jgi:hypothetical protein